MMSPAGGRHGRIANQIGFLLKKHVQAGGLGVVYAAETGFLIERDPDTVIAPDVAFISRARHATIQDEVGFIEMAPDLVVEVLSPNDRFSRVEAKALAWLDAGTPLVLLVDPEKETVHAYRSRKQIQIFHGNETLDCSHAVQDWTLHVPDVFRVY